MINLIGSLIKPNQFTFRRFARIGEEVGMIIRQEEVDSLSEELLPIRADMYTVLVGEYTLRLFRLEFEVI
jgi:hypothetical protein